MRELERNRPDPTPDDADPPCAGGTTRVGIVGRGRVGSALARGLGTEPPAGRGEVPQGCDAILLCVPDAEIEAAAASVAGSARFVGHTSGATPLTALDSSGAERFGLHPLQTVTGAGASLAGCGCAVAGSTPEALALATQLAERLGMLPFPLGDEQRAAYHAAASIASNFLITLEAEAEALMRSAGVDARRALGPLVRTTVENWIEMGPERALTGPVARGDRATVERQRQAVRERRPELVTLFDALVERTEALAAA